MIIMIISFKKILIVSFNPFEYFFPAVKRQ